MDKYSKDKRSLSYEGYGGPQNVKNIKDQGIKFRQENMVVENDSDPIARMRAAAKDFKRKPYSKKKIRNKSQTKVEEHPETRQRTKSQHKSRKYKPRNNNNESQQRNHKHSINSKDHKRGEKDSDKSKKKATEHFADMYRRKTDVRRQYDNDPALTSELKYRQGKLVHSVQHFQGSSNMQRTSYSAAHESISTSGQTNSSSSSTSTNMSVSLKAKSLVDSTSSSLSSSSPSIKQLEKSSSNSTSVRIEHSIKKPLQRKSNLQSNQQKIIDVQNSEVNVIIIKYMMGELTRGQIIAENSGHQLLGLIKSNVPKHYEIVFSGPIHSRLFEDTGYLDIPVIPKLLKLKQGNHD